MMFELEENHPCKDLLSCFVNEEPDGQVTCSGSPRELKVTWDPEPTYLNFQPSFLLMQQELQRTILSGIRHVDERSGVAKKKKKKVTLKTATVQR